MSIWYLEYNDGEEEIHLKETERVFKNYRRALVRRARRNLRDEGRNATGRLSQSLRIKVKNEDGELSWWPEGEEYLDYVDLGVQGAKSNLKAPDSPFKFGSGTGPQGGLLPAIEEWIRVKPVQGRDDKGRFMSREKLAKLIARSVYLNGLWTTNFISDPLQNLWIRYERQFADAMFDDISKHVKDYLADEIEFRVE